MTMSLLGVVATFAALAGEGGSQAAKPDTADAEQPSVAAPAAPVSGVTPTDDDFDEEKIAILDAALLAVPPRAEPPQSCRSRRERSVHFGGAHASRGR